MNRLGAIVDKQDKNKETLMGAFGEFLTSAPVKRLLNSYQRGLRVSYAQVCRLDNRTNGITPNAWLKFANESILTQKVMPLSDAKSAYDSALR